MLKKIFKYITRKNRRGYAIYDSRNMFYQIYLYFLHKSSSKNISRNQKINYLEKIKQNPNNILRILYNARRVANSQRPPRQ